MQGFIVSRIYCLFWAGIGVAQKKSDMKLSNETKVGLLAIVAILVLVLGFNFLKGKSLFSKTPVLFAEFSNIGSLEKSNSVKINGLPVGSVYNMVPKDQ